MEAATHTGSTTIAGLIPRAAAEHGDAVAIRYKRDGAWHDVSYAQLGEIVQEIGLGLIELGLQPGERICILANTRPEWTYADMAATSAGLVVVPIYQTNSPEECLWVISDSEATRDRRRERGTAAEDRRDPRPGAEPAHRHHHGPARQRARATAPPCPLDAIPLEEVRARGAGKPAEELEARRAAVKPDDPFTFIYTSGTTGPPKGCVLTHGNYARDRRHGRRGAARSRATRSSTSTSPSRTPSRC